MNEKQAKKYLKKHQREINQEEIEKIMKEGKIYGDPTAEIRW